MDGPGPTPPTPPPWIDVLLRWLLRMPGLQRWIGRSTALLTFRGRHSGRLFTTPVSYVRVEDRVVVTSHRGRRWWRNLREEPDVQVRLAGRQLHGRARVLRGLEALDAYLTYLAARPATARACGIDLQDGEPDARQAQDALATVVVMAVDLGPMVSTLPLRITDRG